MKKKLGVVGIVILIAVVIVVLVSRSGQHQGYPAELIVSPKLDQITVSVIETGLVEPETKVEIKSKVPGQISAIHVTEGDRVKAGQILLELDQTQYRYKAEQEQARSEEAKIRLAFLEQTVRRKQGEYNSKAISKHVLEEFELEKSLAEIELQKAELAWKSALDDLKYCQIRSPIEGVVILRGVEVGEMVSPGVDATVEGKPLLTIADLSQLLVQADLNQIDMSKIRLEQSVQVRFDALPDRIFQGVVRKISPAASAMRENINLFPVEILLTDQSEEVQIRPGMTADIEILVVCKENVLVLPVEAVLDQDNKRIVQIIKGTGEKQGLEERTVVTGLENDRYVEIVEGLTSQEKVLINPQSAAENELKI
ncbi:efflux RND transporter periplasmic adaptor subunit [bacterium]|nr:efflux RND transporter periplasmic adaptor subunit [bacterium]